tara:strand:- start:442 stop:1509 length:1068 start_codon:yes stop_codon:yes gene_type:complete
MSSLRLLVSQIISEAMTDPRSEKVQTDFALYHDGTPNSYYKNYILYDKSKMKSMMRHHLRAEISAAAVSEEPIFPGDEYTFYISPEFDSSLRNVFTKILFHCIVAVIQTKQPSDSCNFAAEVNRAAAVEGYGPTLYDLVMSIEENGIIADRNSVSRSARKVYRFYAEKRPDVEKKYLDPQSVTDISIDDCDNHTHSNFIKNAYKDAFELWLQSYNPDLYNAVNIKYFAKHPRTAVRLIKQDYSQDFVIDDIVSQWESDKENIEKNLFKFSPTQVFEPGEELDLSFNNDYAKEAFKSLTKAHEDFLFILNEMVEDILENDFKIIESFAGMFQKIKPSAYHSRLKAFFNEHYHGAKN